MYELIYLATFLVAGAISIYLSRRFWKQIFDSRKAEAWTGVIDDIGVLAFSKKRSIAESSNITQLSGLTDEMYQAYKANPSLLLNHYAVITTNEGTKLQFSIDQQQFVDLRIGDSVVKETGEMTLRKCS